MRLIVKEKLKDKPAIQIEFVELETAFDKI